MSDRRGEVLDLWASGASVKAICLALAIRPTTVGFHLRNGRHRGDARAASRWTGKPFWLFGSAGFKPRPFHPVTIFNRNQVLDLWAAGNTIDSICFMAHLSRDAVADHLAAARKEGDARAVIRHRPTLKAQQAKEDALNEAITERTEIR